MSTINDAEFDRLVTQLREEAYNEGFTARDFDAGYSTQSALDAAVRLRNRAEKELRDHVQAMVVT